MLKLTKKADYALMALMHLAQSEGSSSAREIAAAYGAPQDLLAKILQKLARGGFVRSQQGTKGGYRLARPAADTSVMQVIGLIEGTPSLVQCVTDVGACDQFDTCNIKTPLQRLNDHVLSTLARVSLADMCEDDFRLPPALPARGEEPNPVTLPVLPDRSDLADIEAHS